MITKLIGIGAAGNKAAIAAIDNEVISKSDVLLINSTLKDIPHDYDGEKYCFSKAYGGCGKERKIARDHMIADLKSGELNISKFLQVGVDEKQAELVVIVSSVEGGTGSGSAPILARFIKETLGIHAVRCFSFTGFEDDIRGLRNTVEYFQELTDVLAIESVSNAKYLDAADGDRIKAEKMANQDFCIKLSVLMGNMIRESDHNIDPTDHLKICKVPNFSIVEYREFNKIKNKKEFRQMVQDMIDESKSIDLNSTSQKKMAVIINIDKDNTGVIDYRDVLTSRFGECHEVFEHIEYETTLPKFFAFITVGNKVPIKEIEEVYTKYQNRSQKVDTNPDEFFAKEFEFDKQDDQFDLAAGEKTKSASDFFNSLGVGSPTQKQVAVSSSSKKGDNAYFD